MSLSKLLPLIGLFLIGLVVGLLLGIALGRNTGRDKDATSTATTTTPEASVTTAPDATTAPEPAPISTAMPTPEPTSTGVAPAAVTGAERGKEAPGFELKDLDGNKYELSDSRGKVVVLTFWNISDTDSLPMLDRLQALQESPDKSENLVLLAVNSGGSKSTVREVIDGHNPKLTFPILLDPGQVEARIYAVDDFPKTFIIDKNGIIWEIREAPTTEEIEEIVAPLLAE